MSYQGDAAEQVVRLSLETGEIAVRLAGSRKPKEKPGCPICSAAERN